MDVTNEIRQERERRKNLVSENIRKAMEGESFSHVENVEKAEVNDDIQKAHLELFGDSIEKAVYADTAQNRKLGRVGQEYHRGKGGNKEVGAEKHGRAISENKPQKKKGAEKNEGKAQMMIKEYMDALEYDSDISFLDYQYDNDVDLPQKVKEVFDVILSGGNEFVEAKSKVWDWTKIDPSEAWKEKMEKKGYSVADIDTGSDDIMFVAFKPKNLKGSTQSKTASKNFEDYEKKYGTDTSTLEGRMNFWAQSIVSSLKMSRNINQIKFDNLSAELKSYMANPKNDDKDFTLAICDHILNSFTDEQKNKKNLKRKYQTIQKIKNYIENEDYKVYREYRKNRQ